MGFPTKAQLISRKASEQYYINLPSAVAQAMEFTKGETVEWIIADKGHLILARKDVPPNPIDIQKNATPLLNERLQQLIDQARHPARHPHRRRQVHQPNHPPRPSRRMRLHRPRPQRHRPSPPP